MTPLISLAGGVKGNEVEREKKTEDLILATCEIRDLLREGKQAALQHQPLLLPFSSYLSEVTTMC